MIEEKRYECHPDREGVLIYDIETAAYGDSPNAANDELRVFAYYSYNTDQLRLIPFYDLTAIQKVVDEHKFLVGFNNIEYDNPILERAGINLEYKRFVDLMDIIVKRAGGMKTKKGMLGEELMRYSLDAITRFLELVDDTSAKGELDYSILKKTKWSKDEIKEIKEYTERDIEITAKLYEWVEKYFEGFKDFLPNKDVKGKYFLTDSLAKVVYKSICHALKWEPEYDKDFSPIPEEDRIEGGYVSYPAGEKFVGNIYCLDYNSLYPSIMMQCNLYGRNKKTFEGWNGDDFFDVKGFYDDNTQNEVSVLLHNYYLLRMFYKRKLLLEDGTIIKMIDKYKNTSVLDYVGKKYYHVSKNSDGQIHSTLEPLTQAQADNFYKITQEGIDPKEYTIKIIINCFDSTGQIMTTKGIKFIKDCKRGDEVYSINPKNSQLEIKPITDITERTYKGKMHYYRDLNYSFKITPEHKLIVNNDELSTEADALSFVKSKDLNDLRMIPSAIPTCECSDEFITIDQLYDKDFLIALYPEINHEDFFKLNKFEREEFEYSKFSNCYVTSFKKMQHRMEFFKYCDIKVYSAMHEGTNYKAIPYKFSRKEFMKFISYMMIKGSLVSNSSYVQKLYNKKGVVNTLSLNATHKSFKTLQQSMFDAAEDIGFNPIYIGRTIQCKHYLLGEIFKQYLNADGLLDFAPLFKFLDKNTITMMLEIITKSSLGKLHNEIMVPRTAFINNILHLAVLSGATFKCASKKNYMTQVIYNYISPMISSKKRNEYDFDGQIYNVHVKDNNTILAGSYGKFNWIGQTSYGILDKKYYKLVYDKVAAGDCTRLARQWVKLARKVFREEGYKILYTDSVTEDMKVTLQDDRQITVKEYWERYTINKDSEEALIYCDSKEYGDCITPILSCNDNFENTFVTPKRIIKHKQPGKIYEFHLRNGHSLKCTEDHSIISIKDGTEEYEVITPAEAKKRGFLLVDKNSELGKTAEFDLHFADFVLEEIVETEEYFEIQEVYDFSVDNYEKFYANDVLVHNTDSWYFEDVFDDKEKLIRTKNKVIEMIKAHVPFPSNTFDAGIDDEIKAMFFFKSLKKDKKIVDEDSEMDEDDKKHQALGLMKKNYIYVTKGDRLVLKNLGIKKKSISALSKKIFWEYMVPIIKQDFKAVFSKTEIENIMISFLSENLELAHMRKKVKSLKSYKKSKTIIQAQIAAKYGAGIHFMIPNKRHVGVGKGVTYCSDKEFKDNGMSIADIDLEYYRKELDYFTQDMSQQKLSEMFGGL